MSGHLVPLSPLVLPREREGGGGVDWGGDGVAVRRVGVGQRQVVLVPAGGGAGGVLCQRQEDPEKFSVPKAVQILFL